MRLIARMALLLWVILAGAAAASAACAGRDLSASWDAGYRARLDDAAAAHPFPEGRLFEVERDGRRSLLYGTIHVPGTDVGALPAALTDRLSGARTVFVEILLAEEKRMQRALILNPSLILAPAGRDLRESLDAAEWAELENTLAAYGMSAAHANRLAPWFLTLMLSTPPCVLEAIGNQGEIPDRLIERLATEAGREVAGLETHELLFDLFGRESYEEQVDMLRASLPTFARAEDFLATSKALYLRGEVLKIWELGELMMAERYPGEEAAEMARRAYQTLIVARNEAWLASLRPALEAGDAIVAVGALHLGGRGGLLEMLADQGFSVRRLPE